MELGQLVYVHIAGGGVALAAGATALIAQKGSRPHRMAGNLFFISMLIMSSTGAFLAYFQPAAASIVAGLLTFYMVATGWATVMRPDKTSSGFDVAALLFILAVTAFSFSSGMEASNSVSGAKDGFPAGLYYAFGSIAALAAISDVTVLIRKGVSGRQRIARHLWRMCYAMFMATSSFFLGQSQVFPEPLRIIPLLAAPVLIVLFVMFFWLARVYFTRWATSEASG